MASEPQQSIYRRPVDPVVPTTPFAGDLFGREAIATQLTAFLTRMPDGAVLAIDAPWGEGKTWFGRHWHAQLKAEGYRTAYIDCFARDHIDDPFVMIAGELLTLAKEANSTHRQKLLNAGKKLGASLLPAAAKMAVNAAGHWVVGNAKLGDDIAASLAKVDDAAASSIEKLVSKRLVAYEEDKKSVDGFKTELSEMAKEGDKPIVIFVDELDRCRPDFAVRTVERIKHFFEVPRVVFVLLINRKQLTAAIEGLYGARIDANAYLGKFIQLSLSLPKRLTTERHGRDYNHIYCSNTLERYGFPLTQGTEQFASAMGLLATLFGMSLRDIERAVSLYSYAQPVNVSSGLVAWPIGLKLSQPELFRRLLADEPDAHREAQKLAVSVRERAPEGAWLIDPFEGLHENGASRFKADLPEGAAKEMLRHMRSFHNAQSFMVWLFGRVDLTIER